MKPKTAEKGFTLIELLVVLSIVAFVSAAVSMTVITLTRLGPRSSDWNVALSQVQDAGYWICRDVQMSQGAIDDNPPAPEFLRLTVPYESGGGIYQKTVVYQFEDMGSSLRLMRSDSVTGQMMIAQYISDKTATYNSDNRMLTFTITATSGNVSVPRRYEATQRVPPE